MKYMLVFSALAVCAACSPRTAQQAPPRYSIEQFYRNVNVTGGAFSHDASKLLVSSNETGIYNAVALPVDGSEPRQLTNSRTESIFAISYFPRDDRFLFIADQGGNEITHIYMQDEHGSIIDLTPEDEAKSEFVGWAYDRETFFYITNIRDPGFFDLYELNPENQRRTLIYENKEGLNVSAISRDKQLIAMTKPITTHHSEMYLYNRQSGELKLVSPEGVVAQFDPQYFSPDASALYYLSDLEGEFMALKTYDIASGTIETVFTTDWDIWYAYESYNNRYRVIGINADGRTDVRITDLRDGSLLAFPDIEGRSIVSVSISEDEQYMRLTAGSSKVPADIYVYYFADGSYRRLTDNLNPEIDPGHLVEGVVVRYPSFDGLEIPAIYYRPIGCSSEDPCPAIVWVHGGPGGQTRLQYFALIQAMVNHGYAVLGVNNRGSTGYGKTFFRMDNRKHGDVDLQDCIYGKKYLQTLDDIDGDRIGIAGGSYGGYMVMAALAFTPDEFAVGVNIFGVTNWLRTLRSIPPWWEAFREALYEELGDPSTDDSVRLHQISPLFHAHQITRPVIVLQGANDPRVLQVESDEIVDAVRANGVYVEYVLFEDEGHGFRKKENEIEGYGRILSFLDRWLAGSGQVE